MFFLSNLSEDLFRFLFLETRCTSPAPVSYASGYRNVSTGAFASKEVIGEETTRIILGTHRSWIGHRETAILLVQIHESKNE